MGFAAPLHLPLAAEVRQSVIAALLANGIVAEQTKGHKIRAIRVRHGFFSRLSDGAKHEEYRASVILFDYTTGLATHYGLDPETGELISQEPVRGRPQASEEEIQIATTIASQDPEVIKLLASSGPIAGGFVVNAPPGKSASHRYVQMRLFSADFARTVRVVVVDLTDETVALSSQG